MLCPILEFPPKAAISSCPQSRPCLVRFIMITRTTLVGPTEPFFCHHGLPTAVQIVRARVDAHLTRLEHRQDPLNADDILHRRPLLATEHFAALLAHWNIEPFELTTNTLRPSFQCPECQADFLSRTLLAIHRMQDHRVLLQRPVRFDQARDALKGLPTCSHFLKSFHDWTHLRTHIQHRACLVFDPSKDDEDDLIRAQRQLRDHSLAASWEAIAQDDTLRDFLSSKCILCQRFVPRTQELTTHLRHSHSNLADRAVQAGREFMRRRQRDPCFLCLRPRRRQGHLCSAAVNIQAYALHYSGQFAGIHVPSKATSMQHQCHLCNFCCLDENHLHCHQRHHHGLTSIPFPPAPRRDHDLDQITRARFPFTCRTPQSRCA